MRYGTPGRWARFLGERGASTVDARRLRRLKPPVRTGAGAAAPFTITACAKRLSDPVCTDYQTVAHCLSGAGTANTTK